MSLKDIQERALTGRMTLADGHAAMHPSHLQLLEYAQFLPFSEISRIEITEGQVLMTCRTTGLRLVYDNPLDLYAIPLTLLGFTAYEPGDFRMLFRLVEAFKGSSPFDFLDVGANVGWYGLNIAKRFPAASVHAFEPILETFRSLRKNLDVNALPNVSLHNLGLLDRNATQTFFFDPRISGRSSARNLVEDPSAAPVACKVERMDDFVEAHGLQPEFLKVDVEGAELAVFQGGQETLRTHHPLIMAELSRKWSAKFGYHPNDLIALCAAMGYRCYFPQEDRLVELVAMTDAVTATNFFFLHQEKHKALL